MRLGVTLLVLFAACDVADPEIAATTALSSTTDTAGPYVIDVAIDGDLGDHTVRLQSAVNTSDLDRFLPLEMTAANDDETGFFGAIAGQTAGTEVFYFVEIVDGDGSVVDRDPAIRALPNAFGFQVLPADGAP